MEIIGELNIFKDWTKKDVRMMSPLKMAYIGDAVYEVLVRRYILEKTKVSMHNIHKLSTKFVKAEAQSDFVKQLDEMLSDEERSIVKRGRNAKSGTVPKNARVQDYKYATGFEALIGYLYLNDERDRIMDIFKAIIEIRGVEI